MTEDSRRRFLKGGAVVLTTAAAGSVTACSTTPMLAQTQSNAVPSVAGFGWEVSNLSNNGANVYFPIQNAMVLNALDVDVAFVPFSVPAAGWAEVLFTAGVSRGAVPTFITTGGHEYMSLPASPNFGAVTVYNPNGLTIGCDGNLHEGQFHQVILKAYVPADGSASSASRNVIMNSSLPLNVGDYLVFHMDHGGVPVDAEMQVTIQYTLA